MVQNHYIKSNKSMINPNSLQKSTENMFMGEVSADGELTKKHGPFLQWYVQMHIPDIYRVVHNLNRTDYSVAVSKVTNDLLSLESFNLTDVSFDVRILKEGQPVKMPFRFSLSVLSE